MVSSISVVIPAFNAEKTLGQQLDALSRQRFSGAYEVIVADNGSSDGTREVAEGFRSRVDLQVVSATERRGASHARNVGAKAARYDYLAFCDADDEVAPGWLDALALALDSHEFVTGSIDHDLLNPGAGSSHWRSHIDGVPVALRFLPYALSGNMAVVKSTFDEVGGFPEDLEAVGEDVALSWSLQLTGHPLYFEPAAVVAYRHKHESAELWRQHVGFGVADVVLYKRFRNDGVPASRFTSVLAAYLRILGKLPYAFRPERRPSLIRSLAKRWGRLKGSLRERVVYL